MTPARPRVPGPALAAGSLTLVLALASACGGGSSPKADPTAPGSSQAPAPAPVELSPSNTATPKGPIRIGLLVSLTSAPGQGKDDVTRAEGAEVAAYRLGLGGADVELTVLDDQGTSAGALKATRSLIGRGVSGIVVASTGSHLTAALKAASTARTPVLLPYYRTDAALPDGVWSTGPTVSAVDQQLLGSLRAQHLSSPFVVHADGVTADGVGSADSAAYDGSSLPKLVKQISSAAAEHRVDSVVVAASAPTQAAILSQLQGRLRDLPVLLTPEALSPLFGADLAAGTGTTSGRFETVGVDASDTTTLSQTPQAQGVAAFFAALRLAAGDPDLKVFFGGGAFADDAAQADTASHDAVIALVRAVEEAGSLDPGTVRTTLSSLTVTAADGLAGPDLDFSATSTLSASSVVTLRATTQDPGVRPVAPTTPGSGSGDAGALYWFAVPTGS